jgi:hypothetical protein
MTQPAREASNSLIKNCGKGVAVRSGVEVGPGVSVTGIGVGSGVSLGNKGAIGVGVADWQAESRRRHPRRIFFITFFITQLSS